MDKDGSGWLNVLKVCFDPAAGCDHGELDAGAADEGEADDDDDACGEHVVYGEWALDDSGDACGDEALVGKAVASLADVDEGCVAVDVAAAAS